jgi:hypothetical protein
MNPEGLDLRTEFLKYALNIEHLVSLRLADILGVKDAVNSESFGSKNKALSLSAKVNLLSDLEHIAEEKNKFEKFMEIRNKFMHVYLASTYEKCFELIDGLEKWFIRIYDKDEKLTKEEQSENGLYSSQKRYKVEHLSC